MTETMTPMEWAESLIMQLPKNQGGRDAWLMAHGTDRPAQNLRSAEERRAEADPERATAVKIKGTGWYRPAVQTPMGPVLLVYGERQLSRDKATREARALLSDPDPKMQATRRA
jgi:hypothetical protein